MRMVLLADIVIFVFYVFVLAFAASAEPSAVRNLPKWAWLLLLIFVPVIGGILYLVFGRPLSAGPASSDNFRFRGQTPKPRSGPVAPDDDPEFLRSLERRLKSEPKEQTELKPKPSEETQEGDETGKAE